MMSMPMTAIRVKRPFAPSAASLFLSNARSGESESKAPSTPGAVRQVVLDELADDRHPGRAAVRPTRQQLERAQRRVRAQGPIDPERCPSGRPG